MKIFNVLLKCCAALLCAVTLASCSGQGLLAPSAPDLNKQFTLTARVTSEGNSFTADFTRLHVGHWQVTLTEPYEVQGVSFDYSGGSASATFGDMAANALTADFAASPPALIISAFEDTVQDNTASTAYQQDTYTVRSGTCTLTFAQGSSAPIAMELPSLKAEITDFKITGEITSSRTDGATNGADVVVVE